MNMQGWVLRSLSFLTIVVGAGAAGAAPPGAKAGAAGVVNTQPGTMAPPPVTPGPRVLGWPHQVLFGNNNGCARSPFPLEVIVYEDPSFTGKCAILQPGFYPRDWQLMVKNDSISSIKVGQLVRARAFKNAEFGGSFTIYGASSTVPRLTSDWNDAISSMRVELASRHVNCDDVGEGEIGLYESENFGGDCVVLPGDGSDSFATAAQMGIENDSISSIWNNSSKELVGYGGVSFSTQFGILVPPHTKVAELSKDRKFLFTGTEGINDNISSVIMK